MKRFALALLLLAAPVGAGEVTVADIARQVDAIHRDFVRPFG